MTSRLVFSALLGLTLLLCACPEQREDDDDVDDDDFAELPVIPDPGDAENDWGFSLIQDTDVCCNTPEEAYPVGIVDRDAGYIQGVIDPDLNFFYVFRAAASLTEFAFPLNFEEVHLHEGEDLRFGDHVEPIFEDDFTKRWEVEPEHVYVVEITSAQAGFF